MNVISFTAPKELDELIRRRKTAERMTRSEYLRKCVREEVEREQARKMLNRLDPYAALGLSAAR